MRKLVLASGLLTIAGAAVAGPRMAGFERIAAAGERRDLIGAGWGRSGDFRLGGARGSFRRDLDRREFEFGPSAAVAHDGSLGFVVSGAEVGGRLEGRCGAYQDQERIGGGGLTLSAATAPYRMRCAFRLDGAPVGELTLDAVPSRRLAVETARAGEARLGGAALAIRSVHRFEGSRWPGSTPLGYVLEQGGRPVAAVDVNGARKRLALTGDAATRRAAVAAGIALALAWDPGDQD